MEKGGLVDCYMEAIERMGTKVTLITLLITTQLFIAQPHYGWDWRVRK